MISAYWKRRIVNQIVDRDRQAICAARDEGSDFRFKGRESAAVLDDKLPVDVHLGGMRHRAKTKDDSLRQEMIGDDDLPFIPGPTDVITKLLAFIQVVVGCGNRHWNRLLQRALKPLVCESSAMIQSKLPDPVQINEFS